MHLRDFSALCLASYCCTKHSFCSLVDALRLSNTMSNNEVVIKVILIVSLNFQPVSQVILTL